MNQLSEELYFELLEIAKKTIKRNAGRYSEEDILEVVHNTIISCNNDFTDITRKVIGAALDIAFGGVKTTVSLDGTAVYKVNEFKVEHRYCKACNQDLPVGEFYSWTTKEGKIKTQSKCKVCFSKQTTQNWTKDIHRRSVMKKMNVVKNNRENKTLKQNFLLTGLSHYNCEVHGRLPINRFVIMIDKETYRVYIRKKCKECINTEVKEWQAKNPEKTIETREKIKAKYKTDEKWKKKERAKKNRQSLLLTDNYIRRMILLERKRALNLDMIVTPEQIVARREIIIMNRAKRREAGHDTLPHSIVQTYHTTKTKHIKADIAKSVERKLKKDNQ